MCGITSQVKSGAIVTVGEDERPVGVITWVNGFQKLKPPTKKMTEDEFLARLMYLVQHGHREDADELLELYCDGFNVSH